VDKTEKRKLLKLDFYMMRVMNLIILYMIWMVYV